MFILHVGTFHKDYFVSYQHCVVSCTHINFLTKTLLSEKQGEFIYKIMLEGGASNL